jgi:hypothetical protein
MADDNPLLICKAIAMTNREVSIAQVLATKEVVQKEKVSSSEVEINAAN